MSIKLEVVIGTEEEFHKFLEVLKSAEEEGELETISVKTLEEGKMDRPIEKYTTAVVSTNHLPQRLARGMEDGTEQRFNYTRWDYGYIVRVPSAPEPFKDFIRLAPKDLVPVFTVAHKQGCIRIDFDQDGTVYDEVPSWDW